MTNQTNSLIQILVEPLERLLSAAFPPRVPYFRTKWVGGTEDDVQGDGVVCGPMYNVAATGIERHGWEEES